MNKHDNISLSVIRRLPRYYRFLRDLHDSNVLRISSKELSQKMGLTASQIRQDLNCFGEFGQQGYGYNVELLFSEICKILGLNNKFKTVLIGAGNLGKAIATHMDFENKGFELIGIFDINPETVGQKLVGLDILHNQELDSFCEKNQPVVAILTIPKESAYNMAAKLTDLGIHAFWNFSHYDLSANMLSNIVVENVHLGDSMMTLCYRLKDLMQK